MIDITFLAVLILLLLGLSCIVLKRNLLKIVMGINVIGSAANLFLVALGYRAGGVAPIFTDTPGNVMVLATPQALTLTSIVINLAVTALMLSFCIMIYRHYGSLDPKKRRLSG